MLFNMDKTKQCAYFGHMLPLTKWQTDRQILKHLATVTVNQWIKLRCFLPCGDRVWKSSWGYYEIDSDTDWHSDTDSTITKEAKAAVVLPVGDCCWKGPEECFPEFSCSTSISCRKWMTHFETVRGTHLNRTRRILSLSIFLIIFVFNSNSKKWRIDFYFLLVPLQALGNSCKWVRVASLQQCGRLINCSLVNPLLLMLDCWVIVEGFFLVTRVVDTRNKQIQYCRSSQYHLLTAKFWVPVCPSVTLLNI